MKLSHVALLAIAASAAIGLAPIASADVNRAAEPRTMPKSLLPPAPPRNRPPNSSSHSAGIWAPCCSTTDLVHPAVLNHAVGLAISVADLAGVHITFGQDDRQRPVPLPR